MKTGKAAPEEFVVSEETSEAGQTKPVSESGSSVSSVATESQDAAKGVLRAEDLDDPIDPLYVPAGTENFLHLIS